MTVEVPPSKEDRLKTPAASTSAGPAGSGAPAGRGMSATGE